MRVIATIPACFVMIVLAARPQNREPECHRIAEFTQTDENTITVESTALEHFTVKKVGATWHRNGDPKVPASFAQTGAWPGEAEKVKDIIRNAGSDKLCFPGGTSTDQVIPRAESDERDGSDIQTIVDVVADGWQDTADRQVQQFSEHPKTVLECYVIADAVDPEAAPGRLIVNSVTNEQITIKAVALKETGMLRNLGLRNAGTIHQWHKDGLPGLAVVLEGANGGLLQGDDKTVEDRLTAAHGQKLCVPVSVSGEKAERSEFPPGPHQAPPIERKTYEEWEESK